MNHPVPEVQQNYDLSALNTLRLPAKAEAFARFSSASELLSLLTLAQQHNWPVRVLGGGSNVLLAADVHGLVLQSAMTSVRLLREDVTHRWLAVDAGMNWHQWVQDSTEFGHGLENLALIPGSVGASPIQNIGAYGVEVADCIDSVSGIQLSSRQWRTLSATECRFAYRDSIFKHELAGDFIVTRVVFRLSKTFAPDLSYGPLASWATAQGDAISPQALIEQVCDIRQSKLPDPSQIPNAGSFFKNPLVSVYQAQELREQYPALPVYQQADGRIKLAAGWLIEQAGWKGRWLGPVRMHDQQALVLTTNGAAAYADIVQLRDAVVDSVNQQFGVQLEPEPQPF